MKNLKVLLPMLAFIFAIGMAFATTELKEEPKVQAFDYYEENGVWKSVPEQNCQGTRYVCQVQIGENGLIFPLYDEMNDDSPKRSSTPEPFIVNQ